MSITKTIHNYLELSRISNLPTCAANVLTGCAIAMIGQPAATPFPWAKSALVSAAVMCLYVAGMAFNDAMDVAVDQVEVPRRPIPSGRISLTSAYRYATIMTVLGLALLIPLGYRAFGLGVVLTAMILAYDALHHKIGWAFVFMGICRGMIYVVAAAAVGWTGQRLDLVLGLAALLAFYTIAITLVARLENASQIGSQRWMSLLLLLPPAAGLILVHPKDGLNWVVPMGILLLWIARGWFRLFLDPPQIRRAIMIWLQSMCLLDACFLALMGRNDPACVAVFCLLLTFLLHRRISGT